jgi:hypothetical protein
VAKAKATERVAFYLDGRTTVCLILHGNKAVARGVSICSRAEDAFQILDGFIDSKGRKQALSAAREAVGRKMNVRPIMVLTPRHEWHDKLSLSLAQDRFGIWKGAYKPELTPTEKLLLEENGQKSRRTTRTK